MIEGHGTATRAGDPVELTALFQTYGALGSQAFLGSIKSNAGHAQAAAGMLGLIKVLLAGQHGHIPPTLFSDNPTTMVDWTGTGVQLATKLHRWEPKNGIRYGQCRHSAPAAPTRTRSSPCLLVRRVSK